MVKLEVLEEQIQKYMKKNETKSYYVEYLRTKKFGYQKILENFSGENVLELGSDGAATSSILVRWSKRLTIVDMIDKFTSLIKEDSLLKEAIFIKSKWEEFIPQEQFTDIILTDSLEHVDNPVEILTLIKQWLTEDGKIHIIVPNALSFHRLIGVEMGYLSTPYDFNENDIRAEHKRVYDYDTLMQDIKAANLVVSKLEGIQLKFLTDTQLSTLPNEYKEALNKISSVTNKNCAELYACCQKS